MSALPPKADIRWIAGFKRRVAPKRPIPRPAGHWRLDGVSITPSGPPFRPGRPDTGRGVRHRTAHGYDGQGSRLAHIPTGSTTATECDKQDFGGMTRLREARFGGRKKVSNGDTP